MRSLTGPVSTTFGRRRETMCMKVPSALAISLMALLTQRARGDDCWFVRLRSTQTTEIVGITSSRVVEWANSEWPADVEVLRSLSLSTGRWYCEGTQQVVSATGSFPVPELATCSWDERSASFTTHKAGVYATDSTAGWLREVVESDFVKAIYQHPYAKPVSWLPNAQHYIDAWYAALGQIPKEDDLALFVDGDRVDPDPETGDYVVPYGTDISPVGFTTPMIVAGSGLVEGTRELLLLHDGWVVPGHRYMLLTEAEEQILDAPFFIAPKTAFRFYPGTWGFTWGHRRLEFVVTGDGPPTDSLLAYYMFEQGVEDASGNANHGTTQGSPSYALGKFGYGILCDGTDDYVRLPSGGNGDPFHDNIWEYTVAGWVNVGSAAVRQVLYEEGGPKNGINMYLSDGKLWGGAYSTDNGFAGSWINTPISTGWHHVAIVYSVSGDFFRLYLDGDLKQSVADGGEIYWHTGETALGALWGKGRFENGPTEVSEAHHFSGMLDEFRVHTRALTAQESNHMGN